jgi:hypothetical protein
VRQFLGSTARRITIAQSRAIRGTLAVVKTRIKRAGAKALSVPQKSLTPRLITSRIKNGDTSGKLWAGTWMLSPYAVGKPAQGKSGVTGVRGRRYRGAFIGRVYPQQLDKDQVWIRIKSRHFDPKLYPGQARRSSGSVPAELRHRFPLAKAAIEVEPTMSVVFQRDESEIRAEFNKRLRREINFALNLEGRK